MAEDKTQITTPEGRLINSSLSKRDTYTPAKGEPGKPSYKIELAIPKDGEGVEDFLNALIAFADKSWPKGIPAEGWLMNIDAKTGEQHDLISGLIDGDKYAVKREKNGKAGDAYKGCWVLRANTAFDRNGVHEKDGGHAGATVYNEKVELIELQSLPTEVYNGSMGQAFVTLNAYEDEKTGVNGISFYLSAYQKRGDGERLVSVADTSSAFKPVGRKTGGEEKPAGRRQRG